MKKNRMRFAKLMGRAGLLCAAAAVWLCMGTARAAELGSAVSAEGQTAALGAAASAEVQEDFYLDEKAHLPGMEKSWYQGYEPETAGNVLTLLLPIRSDKAAGPVTASLHLLDPDVYLLKNEPEAVKAEAQEGLYGIALRLPLQSAPVNGDYPAVIRICGQTQEGAALETELPYVIRIRGGAANPEKEKPELSLSGALTVGEEGVLYLTLRNPAKTLSLTEGEVLLAESSGSVTVTGRSRLSLPEILPGETFALEIPVLTGGRAAVSLHRFNVSVSCRVLGQERLVEESFMLPVTQEMRMEMGSLDVPPTAVEGDVASMSLLIMNLGKADLCNAMATLELEGISARQSVLAGNIGPGETRQARISFSPLRGQPGLKRGTVTLRCEDEYGNVKEEQFPIELTVVEAPKDEEPSGDPERKEAPSWLIPALEAGCGLFLAAFIVQGALLRGRLRRLEEDRL